MGKCYPVMSLINIRVSYFWQCEVAVQVVEKCHQVMLFENNNSNSSKQKTKKQKTNQPPPKTNKQTNKTNKTKHVSYFIQKHVAVPFWEIFH